MKHPTIYHLSMATAMGMTLSLLATGNANAYTFSRIFDDSGPYKWIGNSAINNQGTVAFEATLDLDQLPLAPRIDTYVDRDVIFTGDGHSLTITESMGRFDVKDINDSNTVAFVEQVSSPRAPVWVLSTSNGSTSTHIATDPTSYGLFDDLFGGVAINNDGRVAFKELTFSHGGNFSLVTSDGGNRTTIADENVYFKFLFDTFDLNNQGTVAFGASLLDGGGSGIFTSNSITPIADTNGSFKSFGALSLNDADTLAFSAFLDDESSGIFTSSNGSFTTIADTSGAFSSFSSPAINNNGAVAFRSRLDTGEDGIFTGSDPIADKVIAIGDPLFGSTITSLGFSNKGFNDAGQIAFSAQLADGSTGVFRADPGDDGVVLDWGGTVTQPIPGTFNLIGIDDFSGQETLVDYPDSIQPFGEYYTLIPHFIIDDVLHLGHLYDGEAVLNTNNVTSPNITFGLDGKQLSLIFPELQNRLGFGFALSQYEGFPLDIPIDEDFLANAVTVKLFDDAYNLLGTFSGDAQPDPKFLGGFFGIESTTPFLRAEITFNEGYEEFAFDNLRYELVTLEEPATVPEPATGLGLLVISTIGAGSVLKHKQK
ncbi:DUF7453 family protein [Coleofasciculus sp. F4-SAH-05]|uniref:DUF7453 family protein n=1 Tax=Coleofasciculus sp. F4-SAH-05 TaxID=3069525 RepID=UPI0032FEE3CD